MKHSTFSRDILALLGAALCGCVGVSLAFTALAAKPGGGGTTGSSVDAKINGSDGPVTVYEGTIAYLSWTSKNVDSCTITLKAGDQVLVDRQTVPTSKTNIPTPPVYPASPLTYTLACTKRKTTVSDSVSISQIPDPNAFTNAQPVTIDGYTGIAMEPFISRDGNYLFFNNSNDPNTDTNLYYATRVDDTHFTYVGEVGGVNTTSLDAAATMDDFAEFYYTTLHAYSSPDFISTFTGTFQTDGTVANPQAVSGLSPGALQWVTMDVGISPDGNTMYYANAYFDPEAPAGSPPTQSTIYVAQKTGTATFSKLTNSDTLLARVNQTDNGELNYAPNISEDGLELFFTRAKPGAQLYVARRTSVDAAFSTVQMVVAADGFVEGPSLSADGKHLYYHKAVDPINDPGNYKIYMVTRP